MVLYEKDFNVIVLYEYVGLYLWWGLIIIIPPARPILFECFKLKFTIKYGIW